MIDESRLDDKSYVCNYIRMSLEELLRWTTLECDWRSVDMEIPYNLVFSSLRQPWGYRYRLYDSNGGMVLVELSDVVGMEKVMISLISSFCRTKWGNSVDGKATLYRFIPQAKRAYRG